MIALASNPLEVLGTGHRFSTGKKTKNKKQILQFHTAALPENETSVQLSWAPQSPQH